ncbi:MAG TPA: glycosyltransferase [Candidatus Saccharimonadales bacterium]|nr:glycosyltransferase [Candidatus Saccharimonadales bacterium]
MPQLTCSIIIPFRGDPEALEYTLKSLTRQELPSSYMRSKVELVLVNDGSEIDLSRLMATTSHYFPITYINFKKNVGRSLARNAAITYAKHDIAIFMDADIVVKEDFLRQHLTWQSASDTAVVIGFRENIPIAEIRRFFLDAAKSNRISAPSPKADFRFRKFVPRSWEQEYPELPYEAFDTQYELMKNTNQFKEFGKYRRVGVWHLPSMLLTCNASMRKEAVLRARGFDARFHGWGMEDTHLGAKLIAYGYYIVPSISLTAYHVTTPSSESDKASKYDEFKANVITYDNILKEAFIEESDLDWAREAAELVNQFAGVHEYRPMRL